jgi:HK97 family phage prohead protease
MTEVIQVGWNLELEQRSDDSTGRKVSGIVVPYDSPTQLNRSTIEVFRKGSLAKTVSERGSKIALHLTHDPLSIIGKAVDWRDDARGMWAEFHVSNTTQGNDALELIRDGVLHSFSIGFKAIANRTDVTNRNGTRVYERKEVRLGHVALVPNPAYQDATVEGLRDDEEQHLTLAMARRRLALL